MLGENSLDPSKILFCGIYWLSTDGNVKWLSKSPYPIGARDRETYEGLKKRGVNTELIGCATMTLPKYEGPRSGVISVDIDGPGERMTHSIGRKLSLEMEWKGCLEVIHKYGKAKEVHTSRLHVALPCIAMGTPVRYAGRMEGRTTILKEIGLKHNVMGLPDLSEWKSRYLEFLSRHIGMVAPLDAPVMPEAPPDP
ncbi:MAG: polysaccharide pyruvyl transferase family protein [Rhodobacteraceae bacterium]|nr:polysaccharide pyruvyl transferase family protein [Paracoccaceae bacterium]